MKIINQTSELKIRHLNESEEDMNLLLKWLNNKNVSDYYGDSKVYNLEEIKKKYLKKINDKFLTACIIEYKDKSIAYVQYYDVDYEEYEIPEEIFYKIVNKNEKIVAIDLFIGEDDFRDKGFGTKIVKLIIAHIFEDINVKSILIDPKITNYRAIKCYKKCGFEESVIIPNREEKDGIKYDNLIMKIDNHNSTV